MSNPLVTIIVAAFNGERFLREALESAFAQEYEPFEVVFVDDGSEDGTADIARSFPVRYVYQENRGLPAARNVGLTLAHGELICFLDADDVLPPTKLAVQARYLAEHPGVGCVLGRQEPIFDGIDRVHLPADPLYGDPGGVPFGSAMVRREAIDRIDGFDPSFRYAEDRDLLIRMRENGMQIAVVPEVVLHRRLHGSNMTFAPPTTHPMLRSLREKLERERAAGPDAADDPPG